MFVDNELRERLFFNKNHNKLSKTNDIKSSDNSVSTPLSLSNNIPSSAFRHNILSFGRSVEEHNSWEPRLNSDGTADFKLFSFPDAKKVYIEVMSGKKNAANFDNIDERGIIVENSEDGDVKISPKDKNSKIYEMTNKSDGVFSAHDIPAQKGDRYRYLIVKSDGVIEKVKDPYAQKQEHIMGWSTLYDHGEYKWKNTDWINGKDPRRISRKVGTGMQGVGALRIMEVNIPTLTKEGDFESAKAAFEKIAKSGIANTIEIMPIDGTYSKGWSYDGVDKFAVNEKLGGPDKLKELIDHAHGLGLNVIMDIVPNHMGPDGDMLARTGPYEKGYGAFGAVFNYEGDDNRYVRDWISNLGLHWVKNYKVDGLRFDMTKPMYMGSDFTLKQMVAELNEHYPDTFLIAEDGDGNRKKITTPQRPSNISHENYIKQIDNDVERVNSNWGIPPLNEIGFDSEWDFVFFHSLNQMIKGEGNMYEFDSSLKNSTNRVKYMMSHDEIGNIDGTRLLSKIFTQRLNLFYNIKGHSSSEVGQRAAQTGQRIIENLVAGNITNSAKWEAFLKDNDIINFIPMNVVKDAFNASVALHKLALGTSYSIPGPKMFFQGDEKGSLVPFKFFRETSDYAKMTPEQKLAEREKSIKEKGYDIATAYEDCLPGRIKYNPYYKVIFSQLERFGNDMNDLVENSMALKYGYIPNNGTVIQDSVHAHHVVKDGEEFFVVKNFDDKFYSNNLNIKFPPGTWQEVINSDDIKYAGSGKHMNRSAINSDGNNSSSISLSANSISFFKKVG